MGELRKFNDECLTAHNGLRKAHKVGPLAYDEKLAVAAQAYAEKLAKMKKMEHSSDAERPNAGENLAFCFKPFPNYKYSGRGASSSWYSEIKDYDFTKEQQTSAKPTGHFTQVIWKECKQAGFGRAQSSDKAWYVVGRYSPAGNFVGKYMENVPRCSYPKWEDVPIVKEYLEELRTWEFTKARKHILDEWSSKTEGASKNGVATYTITENFKSDAYGNYSDSATFSENPTDLPRPEYHGADSHHDHEDHDDDRPTERTRNRRGDHNSGMKEMSSDDEDESFEKQVIRQHNFYRSKHHAPALDMDAKLSAFAKDWAETLVDMDKIQFSNTLEFKNSEIGENISLKKEAMNSKSGERLVDNWYEEGKKNNYSYNREPDNFGKVGHFTQVIWKESSKIGVGHAKGPSGKIYIVCFYYPPGNVKNSFIENVCPPVR